MLSVPVYQKYYFAAFSNRTFAYLDIMTRVIVRGYSGTTFIIRRCSSFSRVLDVQRTIETLLRDFSNLSIVRLNSFCQALMVKRDGKHNLTSAVTTTRGRISGLCQVATIGDWVRQAVTDAKATVTVRRRRRMLLGVYVLISWLWRETQDEQWWTCGGRHNHYKVHSCVNQLDTNNEESTDAGIVRTSRGFVKKKTARKQMRERFRQTIAEGIISVMVGSNPGYSNSRMFAINAVEQQLWMVESIGVIECYDKLWYLAKNNNDNLNNKTTTK